MESRKMSPEVTPEPRATISHILVHPSSVNADNSYEIKQDKILSIVKSRQSAEVDGIMIDIYTAALLTRVLYRLSIDNRKRLLALPIEKMVATSYKLVTR